MQPVPYEHELMNTRTGMPWLLKKSAQWSDICEEEALCMSGGQIAIFTTGTLPHLHVCTLWMGWMFYFLIFVILAFWKFLHRKIIYGYNNLCAQLVVVQLDLRARHNTIAWALACEKTVPKQKLRCTVVYNAVMIPKKPACRQFDTILNVQPWWGALISIWPASTKSRKSEVVNQMLSDSLTLPPICTVSLLTCEWTCFEALLKMLLILSVCRWSYLIQHQQTIWRPSLTWTMG